MDRIAELSPVSLVVIAALIGFFVVSKLFDFFKRGSAWDNPSPPADAPKEHPEVLPPEPTPDVKKRQQEEYKRFLEEEKKRQKGNR